jgi:Uma2 family endonuclease
MADMCFVANDNMDIAYKTYIEGAPDLVVEIVSPESTARDWHDKYFEYEAAGIPEYLIIDKLSPRIALFRLGNDGRYSGVPEKDGKLHIASLPGFWIEPDWFFQTPLPSALAILRKLGLVKQG